MGKTIKDKPEFGARVRQARAHSKLTQHQLADAVGTGQSTIADIENSAEYSGYTAQIARACKVSANWLATGRGPMIDFNASHVADAQLALTYESLNPSLIPVATVIDALDISLVRLNKEARKEVLHLFRAYAHSPRPATKSALISAITQIPAENIF